MEYFYEVTAVNKILGGLTVFCFLIALSVVVFNLAGIHTTKASKWVNGWEARESEAVAADMGEDDVCGPRHQETALALVNSFIWHTNQMFADPNAIAGDFRRVKLAMIVADTYVTQEAICLTQWNGHAKKLGELKEKIRERL